MDNECKFADMKYSFLVCVYYKEKPEYLELSFDSMINQTVKPDEIVLVEDGELTKELYAVIDEYESKYNGLFNIVKLNENKGLGLALNEGFKVCKNELVARMDTDDICFSDRCEVQLERFAQKPELDIVGAMTDEFVDSVENVVSSRVVPLYQEDILKFAKRRSPFNHPTVMYRKSSVMAVGGYGDYRRAQDFDLFTRMLNDGNAIGENVDRSLLYFRADEGNIKRRKNFNTCKGYIGMVYGFWRKGYVGFGDFLFVMCSQIFMLIMPVGVAKYISNNFLRKKK